MRARREMRDDLRFPDYWAPLRLERRFSAQEYERVSAGVIGPSMDDHWFIYLSEDTLFFHRSWTGICIYRVRLEKDGDEYRVVEASDARYRSIPEGPLARDHDAHVALLNFVIDIVLLGKPDPLLQRVLRSPDR